MFKLLKRRGALFIEYALILALVIGIGTFFVSDNSIKNSITSIFTKTDDVLFAANYPNNKAANFLTFATKMRDIDKKKLDGKSTLNTIFGNLGQEHEIKLKDLSEEDKTILFNSTGINVDDFPNACLYTDNPHNVSLPKAARWYISWTGENLSGKEGQNVKVITYAFSANSLNGAFYVGENLYQNGSFTNNCISYKYDDSSYTGMEKLKVTSMKNYQTGKYYYATYNNFTNAESAYDAIK